MRVGDNPQSIEPPSRPPARDGRRPCGNEPAGVGPSWLVVAEDAQTELRGTVKSVSMAPPHPSLQVTAGDGVLWQIDLANPNQTARSGSPKRRPSRVTRSSCWATVTRTKPRC